MSNYAYFPPSKERQTVVTRTRSRSDPFTGNYRNNLGGITTTRTENSLSETAIDTVALGDCQPFEVNRLKANSLGLVSGFSKGAGYDFTFNEYPVFSSLNPNYNHLSVAGRPTDAVLAARLLADTNPSRPVVDLPVFVAELRDFPELFKFIGENAFKTVAKSNLNYWFGWRPLMQDLLKLMDFANTVNDRTNELKALYSSGLRRTRNLWSGSASSTTLNKPILAPAGANANWFVDITTVTKQNVSGHVKWKPTALPPATDMELRNLAIRAAYGLVIDASTAWELIPFSWLFDWCGNIGDYLAAKRNIVNATPYDLVIMDHRETLCTSVNRSYSPNTLELGPPPAAVRESKKRTPASLSLSAYLPFLTFRQLSILGSIALLQGNSTRGRVYGV